MAVGASKLNEEKVLEIKTLFKTTNLKDGEIAKMYDVSRIHINHIRTGYRWNTEKRSFVSKKELSLYGSTLHNKVESSLEGKKTTKNLYDWICDWIDKIILKVKRYDW